MGPGYFSTAGIAVTAGREFDNRDRDGGAPVAIVSQSVANRYFAGRDPIGRRIGDQEFTAVYFAIRQWPSQPHVQRREAGLGARVRVGAPGQETVNKSTVGSRKFR